MPRRGNQRVKKSHSCPIECVGATIGRPPTWRSNAFSGDVISQTNGHGRAMPAQQEFFYNLKYTSSSRPRWRTKLLLFRKTAIKNTPQLRARYLFGAPSGTRTQDPLIKSQLLSLVAHTHGYYTLVAGSTLFPSYCKSIHFELYNKHIATLIIGFLVRFLISCSDPPFLKYACSAISTF